MKRPGVQVDGGVGGCLVGVGCLLGVERGWLYSVNTSIQLASLIAARISCLRPASCLPPLEAFRRSDAQNKSSSSSLLLL